ncbi:hypothetical protein NliqN6_2421 [Naganishia liquefaciens]|uniref:Uncharacterized protein n=1 Tax=Naganishia liquefaciens TaxID=104408 RepID=A0A8H3YE35_9TREE|nr:hypothetical protein NliqN6_2421 [Naganishia liquefaciens]
METSPDDQDSHRDSMANLAHAFTKFRDRLQEALKGMLSAVSGNAPSATEGAVRNHVTASLNGVSQTALNEMMAELRRPTFDSDPPSGPTVSLLTPLATDKLIESQESLLRNRSRSTSRSGSVQIPSKPAYSTGREPTLSGLSGDRGGSPVGSSGPRSPVTMESSLGHTVLGTLPLTENNLSLVPGGSSHKDDSYDSNEDDDQLTVVSALSTDSADTVGTSVSTEDGRK